MQHGRSKIITAHTTVQNGFCYAYIYRHQIKHPLLIRNIKCIQSSFIYGVCLTDLNFWNNVISFILFSYEPKYYACKTWKRIL